MTLSGIAVHIMVIPGVEILEVRLPDHGTKIYG